MSRIIPSYTFHIPHMGKVIDYETLEKKMRSRNPPEMVQVIDTQSKRRLGDVPAHLALLKFK